MERDGFTQVSQRTSFLQCVHDASQVVGRAGHARVLLEDVLRVGRTYACQAWHLGSVLAWAGHAGATIGPARQLVKPR